MSKELWPKLVTQDPADDLPLPKDREECNITDMGELELLSMTEDADIQTSQPADEDEMDQDYHSEGGEDWEVISPHNKASKQRFCPAVATKKVPGWWV